MWESIIILEKSHTDPKDLRTATRQNANNTRSRKKAGHWKNPGVPGKEKQEIKKKEHCKISGAPGASKKT